VTACERADELGHARGTQSGTPLPGPVRDAHGGGPLVTLVYRGTRSRYLAGFPPTAVTRAGTRRTGVGEMARSVQPWLIRVTHWAHAVLFALMAGSGLQILAAFPLLGPRGEPYWWYPLQGARPPELLTIGGWLAGARHWHFAFAWFFTANAVVYLVYFFASGAWRERLFLPRRDARNAWETVLHDLRLRKATPAPVGLYNGMQRLVYTGVLAIAPLLIASGLAMYKPVQLPRLTAVLGGYDAARAIHLVVLVALAAFLVIHVVQAVLHPRTLVDMTTGGARRRVEA
jgi:thiosulfate reductase cytochrome b subunit